VTLALRLQQTQHLSKSQQNEEFADALDISQQIALEWAITAKFYSALHFVQAYLVSRSTTNTPVSHGARATAIQRDAMISGAYEDYRELQDLSREARYDYSSFNPGDLKFAQERLESIKSIVRLHL
jgi:hypothetical protein